MLKKTALLTLLSFFLVTSVNTALAKKPSTKEEKIGYSLGIMLGRQLQNDVSKLDIPSFTQAIEDVYKQRELQLNDEEVAQVMHELQQQIMADAQAANEKQAQENLTKGQEFLAKNAKEKGVKTTKSGLQYKVVKQGKGKKAAETSSVKVHYEGKLTNGEVFDSSYQRGEPVTFQVNQVIAGWQEGLQLMNPGSEYMLYIPANLAYGPAGAGGAIGPNEALVFKVELLEIDAKD